MAGLSASSPVEAILDKENFTLEELLDEEEIIQECKALNTRLINFLREKPQVVQLIRYIMEEPPEDAENRRSFKFPFIACEIFTCEVDVILKTVVEDEEVVICLLLRKTVPFMQYVKSHQEIVKQLVDLIGITSIMEVLIRLIGADEHMFSSHTESMQWMEDIDVLDMVVDKFSSSDSPEVHANAAEILCAITRFAPPDLASKISSPNFVGRLFRHALEDSRPKSVLVNSLCVCVSLLDPKRLTLGTYNMYNRQLTQGSTIAANPETVEGMLESLGELLKLLNVSSVEASLPTTYGKLQPPLGKHRLKIVEFISVLLTVGSDAAEKALIQLGAVQRILDLFFEYPYNNFLHHHVESVVLSCLESKNALLVEHLLHECNLVGRILEAEKNFNLTSDPSKPTVAAEGRPPPKIGNIGHLTCISNKLVQLGNNNAEIQAFLQGNNEWTDWHANVLSKRNVIENVYQWSCGRPTSLQDRTRDSDDDDYQDRDYDVAALANNLSQAFRYGIYSNDDMNEVHGSLERDDEDVYFDDESAEVVISSLRLGDEQESGSLFTNSNWFAFEDEKFADERSTGAVASPSPQTEGAGVLDSEVEDEVIVGDTTTSSSAAEARLGDATLNSSENSTENEQSATDKPPVWVEWRENPDSSDTCDKDDAVSIPNGEVEEKLDDKGGDHDGDGTGPSSSSQVAYETPGSGSSELSEAGNDGVSSDEVTKNQEAALITESAPEGAAKDDSKETAIEEGN
ncbi:hypothetical protein SLEP1_g47655 [Rubroshorea leprosula]|uniref:SIT4 phosphatase-associated family protein n=1 Tax=Rubroshorea leprosula TaxID=152421 RepID=A0AAV5LR73_9ROSI|nr:hypothetical protein SLEP1_g47655 [Rubroshorea leprosula]